MKSPAATVKVFGTYILVAAAGFIFVPNLLLAPLGFPLTSDIWVRVVGLLAGALGYYYWASAVADSRAFFVASIYGRSAFCAGCIGLVLFASAPWQLTLFGLIDLAGAVWTRMALRSETPASF